MENQLNNGFVPVLSERSLQMEATDEVLNDLIGILYRKLMEISIKDSNVVKENIVDKENMINEKIQVLNNLSKNLLDYDINGLIDLRDNTRIEIDKFILNI
ncbi:hypothetical protein [Psychrobacter sp. I-STPA10]|uniref:hypothetical protein n=1 Tax=Psychrobacter sp. I-STPA10 TaxID=2585769 RepID=UPI001E3C7AEB|nr:hypothetical protein [Psychrobacter sp. I-STPA10]